MSHDFIIPPSGLLRRRFAMFTIDLNIVNVHTVWSNIRKMSWPLMYIDTMVSSMIRLAMVWIIYFNQLIQCCHIKAMSCLHQPLGHFVFIIVYDPWHLQGTCRSSIRLLPQTCYSLRYDNTTTLLYLVFRWIQFSYSSSFVNSWNSKLVRIKQKQNASSK